MMATSHLPSFFRRFLSPEALRHGVAARIVLAVAVLVGIAELFPKGLTVNYEYPEGSVWNETDLIAPFAFPIFRDGRTVEREQAEAAARTPKSFTRDDSVLPSARDSIRALCARLAEVCDRVLSARAGESGAASDLASLSVQLQSDGPRLGSPIRLTASQWEHLLAERWREKRIAGATLQKTQARMTGLAEEMYRKGLLDRLKSIYRLDRLALNSGQADRVVPVASFLDRSEIPGFVQARTARDSAAAAVATIVLLRILQPNIILNDARTEIAIQSAVDKVPRTSGLVKQNERIVARHERITAGMKAKLDSYQRERQQRIGDSNRILQFIGRIGHTAAILFPLVLYLFLFRRRIFSDNSRLLLIAIVILLEAGMAYLTFRIPVDGPLQYLILVPTASMLLAILFDSRVAFYSTIAIAFLVGALRGNDYALFLASAIAGTLALYTVRDITHRTQIFRSLAFICLGYFFAIAVDGLQRSVPLGTTMEELGFAFGNAVLSPVLTFGLLIFFEKVFGITTDLTLLELLDFNHPLLRKLATHAPGTFHHSVVMGMISEAAAAAIGANSILARVGAYYHDIGKCIAPETYVENQMGGRNIHDELEPRESARRIINHVQKGIALGREHGLPERVIDFIPAHHGTTKVAFFLRKEAALHPDEVAESLFQYPGPKPSTKEMAIVMLADTIEASARTLEEPTVEKLRKLVDDVVESRRGGGELDECDITFRQLREVKTSFLTSLTGIHHVRIKYPSEVEADAARKLAERTAKLLNLPSTADALSRRMKNLDVK